MKTYLKHFIFLLLWGTTLCATAQALRISGDVSDLLTQEGVARAVVKLMTVDSDSVIASDTTRYRLITEKGDNWQSTFADKYSGAVFSLVAPLKDEYLLVVEANGYEEYICRVASEEGKDVVNVPSIYLEPKRKARRLDEVVVNATRIKMFYHGDTIIYNADALNVTQTESLRKLVQQMPGAEMKDDGEIRINGKRVDNLLISGKDFFQGNIQAALDNLPAYVVGRIKVYDKAGDQSDLTGRNMHDESYVMDVHLKRKYIGMWMAKLSADGGTGGLWGGQAFLMRFDDRQMFTINGDINNFNVNRQMMDIADTQDTYPSGRVKTKAARFSYYIEPNKMWRFTSNGAVKHKDTNKQSWQNNETYLSPNNLMSRSEELFEEKELTATVSAGLRARKSGRWEHSLNYDFSYARNHSTRDTRSIAFYLPGSAAWEGLSLDSIIALEAKGASDNALLYSVMTPALLRSHNMTHRPNLQSSFVFGADLLNFKASFKHDTQIRRDFSNYLLTTYADGKIDARRRYLDLRDYLLDLNSELEWVHQYERLQRYSGVIKPFVSFSYRYGTASHPEYRLERMAEWSNSQSWRLESLGSLPQAEWQNLCLDEANSYYSTEKEDKAQVGVRLSHKVLFARGTSLLIDAAPSVYYQHRTLDYDRENRNYNLQRDGLFFRPYLTLKWKSENQEGRIWMHEVESGYQGQSSMPTLTQLLPIRDVSDPLNLFVGNADLGNSFTHEISSTYRLRHVKTNRLFNINATYRRIHNDIATQSNYDPTTGIRTYRPVNTSRTHAVKGRTEFSSPLDSKQRLFLSIFLSADYNQAENLSFLTAENTAPIGLHRNVGLSPGLTLRATYGSKFRFYGRWSTAFRHISQPGVSNNYRETALYVDLSYILPWDIQFSTILKTTLYAGNSQAVLNRTVTNWDASLSKYFLNNRLGIHIKAHDLLAQANSLLCEVTTVGRIEQYSNVLPRYVMLTVSYNFNWVGKK
jgi:hypothetical protein